MTESDIGDYDSDFEYPEEDFVEPEWDPEPEPDILPRIPPSQPSDAQKREHAAIEEVVECMNRNGIRFDTLVYALCYGNPLCSSDNGKLKVARNQLMKSSKLPTILDHLHTPPSYTGARPEAASKTLDEWSWKHVTKLSRIELDHFAVDARKEFEKCDDEIEDLTNFDNLNFDALKSKALLFTPNLLQFLTNIGETKTHARNRRRENSEAGLEPSFASVMNIHSLAFQMTPRCNRLQKQLSLYFRSKHAPKSLFTLFNKCGYVSSYIWSSNAIRSLSEAQLKKLKDLVANHAIFWIYDNLRLAIPMKAQRGDRHTVTDNGTAMTVVAIPDAVKHIFMEDIPTTTPSPEPPVTQDTSSISPMVQDETRDNAIPPDNAPTTQDHTPDNVPAATEASSPPALSWDDFSDVDRYKRLTAYNIYFIIDILFKTVPGLADLDIRNDESLSAPPSRHMMASGEDFKTLYHMLGITPVDETTIGGNLQVLGIMLQQQGLDSELNQKILGLGKRKIPCVGDNMTTTRLETARNLRTRDPNGYERLDWLIIVPGWFHILLNLGMATFDSHRGGDKTMSFIRDITLLGRTGLTMNMRKKRPDFFAMDEFLRHKLFALIRSLWMHYSGTETLDDLVTWVRSSPKTALRRTAERIHRERMSSEALEILSESHETDEVLTNTILQSRDLLQFYSTRRAIQTGNVGLLEDLLPSLLVYFKGHENHNYAQGLAECMQWMRYDAPPGMSDAVRDHVWLVNTSGRPEGFYESDRLQEHNNDRQKKFGPAPQAASWQAHAEISPAIPILGQLAEKVEDRLIEFKRTRVHKEISAELDISRLATRHMAHKIHQCHADRVLDEPKDKAKDYIYLGEESLVNTGWLENLNKTRQDFVSIRATKQEYRPTELQEEENENEEIVIPSPAPGSHAEGSVLA